MSDALNAAIQYASLGWYVLPVHSAKSGKCTCGQQSCTSPGKHPVTKHGLADATIDPAIIQNWWVRWPWANVAILTGEKSNLVVLDIDPRHQGDDTLKQLEDVQGKIPDTIESLTGGGGRHLFFKRPKISDWLGGGANVLGPGIDLRADGGYVVAPPSGHASGSQYEWEISSQPVDVALAELPGWIQALIIKPGAGSNSNGKKPKTGGAPTKSVQSGSRNATLTSMAGAMRRKGMPAAAIEAALLETNREICSPPLVDSEVIAIAKSVGRYNPPSVPTDDELADEWLAKFPDTKYGLGDFRRYQNGIWPVITDAQAGGEILQLMEEAKKNGLKPSSWKLESIKKLASLKCAAPNEQWNSDPNLLACKNGTLLISSRKLLAHAKENYLTSSVSFDFDPFARADHWEDFLNNTIPDAMDFLQEFSGYCLTMDVSLETAVWLYGPAGSGKSTFIWGLQAMLGDRAGVLGLADLERSRFALTNLPGKTLLVSTEQPAVYVTVAHILNTLISGETFQMERKFREPVLVTSKAKFLWAMNEMPRISEAGSGIFRRLKVVEFHALNRPQDPQLKQRITTEGAGILNWALSGLAQLHARGRFDLPACVISAIEEFKAQSDVPRAFVEEKCKLDGTAEIKSSALYDGYRIWCGENGHKAQSSTSLALDWKRLGFKKIHKMDGTYWIGLAMKP